MEFGEKVQRPKGVPREKRVTTLVQRWGMERVMQHFGPQTIQTYPHIFDLSLLCGNAGGEATIGQEYETIR